MIVNRRLAPTLLLSLLSLPALVACGSSGDDATSAGSIAGIPGAGATTSSAAAAKTHVASLNVCATLSDDDITAVARSRKLGGDSAATAVYAIKKTPTEHEAAAQKIRPMSGCRISIELPGAASGIVALIAQEADGWSLYAGDSVAKKLTGIGDEAVTVRGTSYMKVGDVQVSAGENSMTDDFTVELLRKMAPGLRSQLK